MRSLFWIPYLKTSPPFSFVARILRKPVTCKDRLRIRRQER